MHLQYTKLFLGLPEVILKEIKFIEQDEIHIELIPKDQKQLCPICGSIQSVIRKGMNGVRKVRHLSSFGKRVYLALPAIRLWCKACNVHFSWKYSFVGEKKRYTNDFEKSCGSIAAGSTSKHAAQTLQMPHSTAFHKHKQWLKQESHRIQETVWKETKQRKGLVLGIDDFAIRKGHTYNTGIHDLRGETLLSVSKGRKLKDLCAFVLKNPDFLLLNPKAVVMDLSPTYHRWIQECFPNAIRVADRFHVAKYVHSALQNIRKEIQDQLKPLARSFLKKHHRLLNSRLEQLSEKKKQILHQLFGYSTLLKKIYEWKEAFNEWYDYSPSSRIARIRFESWCRMGEKIEHQEVGACLRTMRNWQTEIINYHHCRFTNASVEGRNNKMKAYQRRHYFTRNRENYVSGLYVECNRSFDSELIPSSTVS